jgi:excisionase family DNA binding protein
MTETEEEEEELLDVNDVAKRLKVSPFTVYAYVQAGRLEAVNIGGQRQGRRLRFKPSVVERFLRERGRA